MPSISERFLLHSPYNALNLNFLHDSRGFHVYYSLNWFDRFYIYDEVIGMGCLGVTSKTLIHCWCHLNAITERETLVKIRHEMNSRYMSINQSNRKSLSQAYWNLASVMSTLH